MSVADSIKAVSDEQKDRLELVQYGNITFSIVNGKVRQTKINETILIDQGESQG